MSGRDRALLILSAFVWGSLVARALIAVRELPGELHALHLALEDQTAIALGMVARARTQAPTPAPGAEVDPAERCTDVVAFAGAELRCVLRLGHDGQHKATAVLS